MSCPILKSLLDWEAFWERILREHEAPVIREHAAEELANIAVEIIRVRSVLEETKCAERE